MVSVATTVIVPVQIVVPPRIGVIRATRYTPAFTIVAECR